MARRDDLTPEMARLADEILGNGIDADEVMRLRRETFKDGVLSRDEARLLFHLNEQAGARGSEAWYDFFVEALSDFFVWKQEPPGYLSDEDARFLVEEVSRDGHIDGPTEFGLIVNVLEKLRLAPANVVELALKGVVETVLGGARLFGGDGRRPGVITPADVDVIRAVAFAAGGDGSLTVTKREADLLFELNNETAEAENAPEWQKLFVQAVGHYLMFPAGAPAIPDREEAARREAWLESRRGTGRFMAAMATSLRGTILGLLSPGGGEEADSGRQAAVQAEAFAREAIDEAEASWLLSHIKHDGVLHENEKALLAYIKEMSPRVHASLEPLMQEAGL